MKPESKLSVCGIQTANFLARLGRTLQGLQQGIQTLPDLERQLLLQMSIIQVHSYLDGFFRCLVTQATFWEPEPARQYLSARRPDQADNIIGLPLASLCAWVKKEVAFGNGADGLKGVVQALFGISPFGDEKNEWAILDLVIVRNVCVHDLGQVAEAEFRAVRTPGVIVSRGMVGKHELFGLMITPQFITASMLAVAACVAHVSRHVENDARFARVTLPDSE